MEIIIGGTGGGTRAGVVDRPHLEVVRDSVYQVRECMGVVGLVLNDGHVGPWTRLIEIPRKERLPADLVLGNGVAGRVGGLCPRQRGLPVVGGHRKGGGIAGRSGRLQRYGVGCGGYRVGAVFDLEGETVGCEVPIGHEPQALQISIGRGDGCGDFANGWRCNGVADV